MVPMPIAVAVIPASEVVPVVRPIVSMIIVTIAAEPEVKDRRTHYHGW
jgi:hypothetical protein